VSSGYAEGVSSPLGATPSPGGVNQPVEVHGPAGIDNASAATVMIALVGIGTCVWSPSFCESVGVAA